MATSIYTTQYHVDGALKEHVFPGSIVETCRTVTYYYVNTTRTQNHTGSDSTLMKRVPSDIIEVRQDVFDPAVVAILSLIPSATSSRQRQL
jgi:hypothetical protein